jgi:hypothetical protein
MTSALLNKINIKSKQAKFEASRNYKGHGKSSVPYEELVVLASSFPDFIFLVHKNMIFDRNSVADSSYEVYSFDRNGNYIRKENLEDLGSGFFMNMKVIKKL